MAIFWRLCCGGGGGGGGGCIRCFWFVAEYSLQIIKQSFVQHSSLQEATIQTSGSRVP